LNSAPPVMVTSARAAFAVRVAAAS
jgi:hypothetical protein